MGECEGACKRGAFYSMSQSVSWYNEAVSFDLPYDDFCTYDLIYCDEDEVFD